MYVATKQTDLSIELTQGPRIARSLISLVWLHKSIVILPPQHRHLQTWTHTVRVAWKHFPTNPNSIMALFGTL